MATSSDSAAHLVPLPGTEWHVWRSALLRSAGFPVDGMDAFAAPGFAAVADAHLAGRATAEELATAYQHAVRALGEAVHAAAGNPLFRQAMTWQNPGALSSVDGVLRDGPYATRNERRRRREDIIAKYWQRYSVKNDTIGFFGPICWTTVDSSGPTLVGRPGPALTRRRVVHFEWWAMTALAERIGADPRVRPWLPVGLQPHLSVRDRRLHFPDRAPQPLTAPIAELLARCDGRPASELATELTALPDSGFRRAADVHAQLAELAGRGVLRVGFDLPMDLSAETTLRAGLDRIGEPAARAWALAALDRLSAARDATASATEPDTLAAAMADLEATFVDLTGREARQRPGQTYAGRTLCHLDTVRDLDVAFGAPVLARLAPLDPLLRSARWLTSAIGAAYRTALTELHQDLAADLGSPDVPFSQLWFLAAGAVFGTDRPADPVVADFLRRWAELLGLARAPADARELRFTTAELAARVDAAFPAQRPGWANARIHSPDVHLCAPSWAALARGELTVVLGELHIGWAAFDTEFFTLGHPAPGELAEALRADLPDSRVALLLPHDWPRNTARNAEWLHGPDDVRLGFAPAPGASRDRLVPVTALTVSPGPDGPVVHADDGRTWPVLEVFAQLLGIHAFDTWKLAGGFGHTPRIVVDDLVLVRETWRTTVGLTGLAGVTGELDRYLAARRWRRELGLPERVFVRVATELKPCFVDLTSPVYVRLLCTLLRGAQAKAGLDTELMVTEMLPTAEQAWLVDADGHRYTSELRLQIRDPQPARHG